MISRIYNFLDWIKLFLRIFKGRGLKTYGRAHVNYLITRYRFEHLAGLEDLNLAAEAIDKISKLIKGKIGDLNLQRIGPTKDSGYVSADLFDSPHLVSGGAGKNVDFEIYFADKGSSVTLFDPTVEVLPRIHSNMIHISSALESKTTSIFRNSKSLVDLNLKQNPNGLYLKLDIEGSEWDLLLEMGDKINVFDQMFIEFHDLFKLSDPTFRSTAVEVIEQILLDFKVVNYHPNNWRTFVQFGKAFIPEVFEVTFVRNDNLIRLQQEFLKKSNNQLNYPNNPNRPESPLGMYNSKGNFIF